MVAGDEAVISKGNHLEQREKLGLGRAPNPRSSHAPHPDPTNSLQKVEVCSYLVLVLLMEVLTEKALHLYKHFPLIHKLIFLNWAE